MNFGNFVWWPAHYTGSNFDFDGGNWEDSWNLTLGISRKVKWLKEIALYHSMTVRKDMSKNNANQQEARNGPIVDSNEKIMYGNNMRTNRNELMRRLLSVG